jgi:saccharopine dehydrogenase-like NADP-dependent oxidoreductase
MKVFETVDQLLLSKQEMLGTLNTLTFIKRKRCGRIKTQTYTNGRHQRNVYQKWEASSPTVRTESVLFTSMLDAHEGRVIGVYNIPGAFLHTKQTDLIWISSWIKRRVPYLK